MATDLSLLQDDLADVEERLTQARAAVKEAYAAKSYSSQNSSGPSHSNHDIDQLEAAVTQLEERRRSINREINRLSGTAGTTSAVAGFNRPR